MIYEGATPLRSATKEEAATMPVFSTWGLKVISLLAERAFVEGCWDGGFTLTEPRLPNGSAPAPPPGPGIPVALT